MTFPCLTISKTGTGQPKIAVIVYRPSTMPLGDCYVNLGCTSLHLCLMDHTNEKSDIQNSRVQGLNKTSEKEIVKILGDDSSTEGETKWLAQ